MKKIVLIPLALGLVLVFAGCLINLNGQAVAEELYDEVMEVRLFFKNGKLVDVEGINPEFIKGTKATGEKYTYGESGDLPEQKGSEFGNLSNQRGIQQIFSVLTQRNSPGCTIWYMERTETSYKKVCLN